jgi:hypothetical protein
VKQKVHRAYNTLRKKTSALGLKKGQADD